MRVVPVQTPPGGILTRVAGAVTGPVDLGIHTGGHVVVVAYRGSDDWYRVAGSAAGLTEDQIVSRLVRNPGMDRSGNPIPSRLA